ncbi:hypothetical protein A5819_003092 [Enterococcus sp. 7E2_DIV0204]|uniref:lasso peptide biosynthesis B2 protein n=1 Tax=unclassified Enterococcus TaxID=2608891 RepID=UPI000A3508EE|nr:MULTISPECIES: lasso peptide biosynthesis B2 protein [unclassified Enterococcus]OTN90592.1 hypothetical protein A5819_003092 [Enterococcus sp. 7E2_DIV0204]OTP53048.1 hypothetical protein A5884_002251 [Enterococcus sp. 7D2_DIV0200]
MNIPLFSEKPNQVPFRIKWLARIALLISAPLNWVSPSMIERLLLRLMKKKPVSTRAKAQEIRDGVCGVSKRCRSQEGCLRRSLAVTIAVLLQRKSISWCTGYALEPFRAHAWVEIEGEPIGEPDEVKLYSKSISIPHRTTIQANANDELDSSLNSSSDSELDSANQYSDDTKAPTIGIRKLFSLTKGHNREFILILMLGLVSAALTLVQPNLVADLVDQANLEIRFNTSLGLLIIVLTLSTILTAVQYYLLQKVGEGVVFQARKSLVSHLLRLPICEYDERNVGDLLSRVIGDSSQLKTGIIQGSVALTSGIFIVIGAAVGMILRDSFLFMIVLITICLAFIGIILMSTAVQRASFKLQQELGKLSGIVERDLHAIRTIRAANITHEEEEKSKQQVEKLYKAGIKLAKIQSLLTPISNMSLQVCGLIVIGIGGYRVSIGAMAVADFIAFALLLYMIIGPVGQILNAFSGIGDSLGAFARIQELLDLALENEYDVPQLISLNKNESIQKSAIFFNGISFSYNKVAFGTNMKERDNEMILRDITLCVEKGKRTAIVGPSGAGKSTILQLIERFYELNSGEIYVNGVDYRNYSREELRQLITYVEQDSPVISGTLRENLLLGNLTATDEECIKVLHEVNLKHLLERASNGLDVQVGEGGARLSGGERQRLAMARSLLSKAEIVLLDELTSNLDSLNEIGMKKAVDKMKGIKTVIIVAHRLSTVVDSDAIYVLEHGRVVGTGNHNELLETVPLYRELAKEQFVDFQV